MWAFVSVSARVPVCVYFLEFKATKLKFKSSRSHSRAEVSKNAECSTNQQRLQRNSEGTHTVYFQTKVSVH